MKNSKKIIVGVVALVVLLTLVIGVYLKFGPQATEGTKAYEVTVTDNNGDVTTYNGTTDAEYLSELMDELKRTIEAMEIDYYKPAVRSVRSRILSGKLK